MKYTPEDLIKIEQDAARFRFLAENPRDRASLEWCEPEGSDSDNTTLRQAVDEMMEIA